MGDVLHRAMSLPELLSLFRCPSRTLKTPLMDRPARREGHGSIFGHVLQLVDDAVVWHGAIPSFSGRVLSRRTVPGPLFQNKRDFLNHRARLTCAWHGSE